LSVNSRETGPFDSGGLPLEDEWCPWLTADETDHRAVVGRFQESRRFARVTTQPARKGGKPVWGWFGLATTRRRLAASLLEIHELEWCSRNAAGWDERVRKARRPRGQPNLSDGRRSQVRPLRS